MSSIIVDAHYDLLMDVFRLRRKGETRVIERFYLDDLRAAGVNVLICSLFVSNDYVPEMALRVALTQIAYLHTEMRESPGLFALCRTAGEARRAVHEGRLALFLSFEGVDPLGYEPQLLSVFYELGVRLVGLVWSRRNAAADGCHFRPLEEGVVGGLTPFGVTLLKEIERLGMILDVSHLNDVGLEDVFRFFKGPVIASHSNCRALCGVARNLTDAQIAALAARGGVMGLNNMMHFVYPGEDDRPGAPEAVAPKLPPLPEGRPRYAGLLDHARHILEVAGEDHVGLGLDLCEFALPEEARIKSVFPSYRHVAPFIEAVRREFSPSAANKLLGENWMRVLEKLP
ncbi:dipeptidase [Fretibacterium sp. OH1220_COT-178]|uniref:dipeptidase n=1 Tax=Fretibacterium sp. OH1220_COT-178 TaxID=2491047 RepID=UPI000F5EDD5F|nr:membrane dipeptidase [Fretibacterium sp. OH1220_COT-178]RRD65712.1 membrane dipeptidase [Fretibacterium sp. OH1220_COT-178]